MHICLVTHAFPPAKSGWSTYARELALALRRRGHMVSVLAPRGSSLGDASIKVYPVLNHTVVSKIGPRSTLGLLQDVLKLTDLFFTGLGGTIDVVHVVSEYPTLLLAPLLKTCARVLVATCHGTYSVAPAYTGLRPIFTSCLKSCDAVVAVSNFTRSLISRIYGLKPSQVHVVPNGVDLSRFKTKLQRNEARKALGLPADHKVVLTVGRALQAGSSYWLALRR